MGRTACTEPQCLYNGALYLYLTVELYLYSPYGPYGLYRASVRVQGCTLPLPNSRAIPVLPVWAVRPVQSLNACTVQGCTYLTLPIYSEADQVNACTLLALTKTLELAGSDPLRFSTRLWEFAPGGDEATGMGFRDLSA